MKFDTPDYDFVSELRYNNAVFAAFKTHAEQSELHAAMFDDKDKVRSFAEFRKAAEPIIGRYNSTWLHTEYNTAIKRAQFARQMLDADRNRDILPNWQWLPSTAVEPRAEHQALYYKIWPLGDPFLATNGPGCLWGCLCSGRTTAQTPTDRSELKQAISETLPPQKGLDENPVKCGALFTASHPYFVLAHIAYKTLRPVVEKFAKRVMIKYARSQTKRFISTIHERTGVVISSDNFITGKMTFLRSSIKQVSAHAENYQTILRVLSPDKCTKDWQYVGWSETKAGKHNEADYFTYYKTKIGKQTYYANVKMHKNIGGEVLYTVNSHKPKNLIKGLPPDLGKYKK